MFRFYPLRIELDPDPSGGIVDDPPVGTGRIPDVIDSFEAASEEDFNVVLDWVVDASGMTRSSVSDFVEAWGLELSTGAGVSRKYPTWNEVFAASGFTEGVKWLPRWADSAAFPNGPLPVFQVEIDGDWQVYRMDYLRGAIRQPVEGPDAIGIGGIPATGPFGGIPIVNAQDLVGGPPPPTGGRGRAPRVFDRDQLVETGNQMWRSLLLGPDSNQVGSAVDDYMRQANGFWRSQGGSLDFETFMLERIRGTDRYGMLYEHKPSHMSEGQWIASHTNVVNSFPGLRPSDQRRELETSLTSGGSLAGQATRIGQSERVFRANPSAFTTRLANTVARLGPGARR